MTVKKSRAKRQAVAVPVPQSAAEADEHIRIIGECQRHLSAIETAQAETVARTKAGFAEQAAPYEHEIRVRSEGLQTWCEAHRAELTKDGSKTVRFAAGEVCWRLRPASVTLSGVKEILGRIQALGLDRFLRTKVEIDKEAMLKEPEAAAAIAGVSIGSTGEDFIITPDESPLATTPALVGTGGDA